LPSTRYRRGKPLHSSPYCKGERAVFNTVVFISSLGIFRPVVAPPARVLVPPLTTHYPDALRHTTLPNTVKQFSTSRLQPPPQPPHTKSACVRPRRQYEAAAPSAIS
jgi:hypothetical protein